MNTEIPIDSNHEPPEDGCAICGFMNPDFQDYEKPFTNCRPRELQGIAGGDGSCAPRTDTFYPIWRKEEPQRYENHARSSFNIEDVSPHWLRELVRLFPEPSTPCNCNDPRKFRCWIYLRITGNSWSLE